MVRLCALSLLCAVAVWLLKSGKSDQTVTAALALGGVVLLWLGGLQLLSPVIAFWQELGTENLTGSEGVLLLRGLGVACIAQFAADFCRQSGEANLAAAVEWVGRAELLLLCLPLLQELLALGKDLLASS